jgi:hypothetical protein
MSGMTKIRPEGSNLIQHQGARVCVRYEYELEVYA